MTVRCGVYPCRNAAVASYAIRFGGSPSDRCLTLACWDHTTKVHDDLERIRGLVSLRHGTTAVLVCEPLVSAQIPDEVIADD